MQGYIGSTNVAAPCPRQGLLDWFSEPTYLTGPATTPIPGPASSAPTTVYVDVWSPSIPKGRDWVAVGATVAIPVPSNATRYRAWFLPAAPSSTAPAGTLPNGAPVAFVEAALGPVPSGGGTLTLTPTWARLNEDDLGANVLRASLVVEFVP